MGASKDTRFKKPLDLPRPRYPERAGPASSPGEVAAFFGMVYLPDRADEQEDQGA